jgi:hypothetical protein
MRPRTVNATEIAELLGVTHQRTSVIVSRGSRAGRPGGSEPRLGSARGHGVVEEVAAREPWR